MPKLKTHRGARKRFKVTAGKKILHSKTNKRHILTKKKANRKRNLGQAGVVKKSDRRAVKEMMPYAF